jgi:predicted Ser/Thr protein kinase
MTGPAIGEELGGYRLEAVAGRGGMGIVYRARQLRLDRVVALKVIAPELSRDDAFRARFQREARLLAAVDDPHVIPVYEAGEADDELFLSMRWIDGGDLADEIARTGGLDPVRAQRVLVQVAGALDAVHDHELVHGDLKPANVLLERRDGAEHAYLSDFGAGRQVDTTASGQWLGTVEYVAPETIQGAPPDRRSDLYGLACVVFEALTGAPPFHRDTAWATLWAHANDPPPSACERRPALPPAVDAVLARGLAKEPAARYDSAKRFLQALGDALLAARGTPTQPVGEAPGHVPVTGTRAPGPSTSLVPTGPGAVEPRAETRPARRGAGVLTALRPRRRRWALIGVLVAACAVAVVVAVATAGGGSSAPKAPAAAPVTITRTALGPGAQPFRVAADTIDGYVLDTFCQCVDVVPAGVLTDRVHLPAAPRSLVVDSARKLLWVGLDSHRLVAIGLASLRVVDPGGIKLPISPDLLTVLGGEVIVEQKNPAKLIRVDAVSRHVVGAPVTPGGTASSLVTDSGGVASALVFPVRLVQFNANLERTGEHPVPQVAVPGGMAVDSSGYLWMADYDAARVWRIDPSTGSVAGAPISVGQDPASVAVSGTYVWVVNAGDQTVTMINEEASQVRGVTIRVGGDVGDIAGSLDDPLNEGWMPSDTTLLTLKPNG